MAGRERNVALGGAMGQMPQSAGFRRDPREHARSGKKKGQPRTVGLYLLVEGAATYRKSVSKPVILVTP